MNSVPAPKEPLQRNYVFVDEHNRHKRLKVMRACEGCRRRKIKCDSATTNTWPCAACVRLKVECVPPTTNLEKEPAAPGIHVFELQKSHSYPQHQTAQNGSSSQNGLQVSTFQESEQGLPSPYSDATFYHNEFPAESNEDLTRSDQISVNSSENLANSIHYQESEDLNQPQHFEKQWSPESSVQQIETALGNLKVEVEGKAGYIADQSRYTTDEAVQDYEPDLPNIAFSPGVRVQIPESMMPSDQQAMVYFKCFFASVHPFMPVLCQNEFYSRWHNHRDLISPLLLEAIFACSTAALHQSKESSQWLALADRHEDYYKDSSRLSTVQALLLLMKAREYQPKRGYFYRSWMYLVGIINIAKDLGLGEHHRDHEDDDICGFPPAECICRTRIWQLVYILECMIGGPQGRLDFNVKEGSVDLSEPRIMAGVDAREHSISRQFVYLTRIIANIRETISIYREVKTKDTSYAAHPRFATLDQKFSDWFQNLPADLQIQIPQTGYEHWGYTNFIAFLHSYYYLSLMMHYRPRFHHWVSQPKNNNWKRPLLICLDSAQKLCRIHESLLNTGGVQMFEAMLRGMSYTIYSVLTCTALQLAAITAPDSDINHEASAYFTRSMRLLEECCPYWPIESVRGQIDNLRRAFSADVDKPFELKPGFPTLNSPPPPEPPVPATFQSPNFPQDIHFNQQPVVTHIMNEEQPLTPPISITGEEFNDSQLPAIPMLSQPAPPTSPLHNMPQEHWNPIGIFDQWQTAFHAQPRPESTYSPTLQQMPISDFDLSPTSPYASRQGYFAHSSATGPNIPLAIPPSSMPTSMPNLATGLSPNLSHSNMPGPGPSPTSYPASYASTAGQQTPQIPSGEFVSPSTWQNVVASSFGNRLKRGWEGVGESGSMMKRQHGHHGSPQQHSLGGMPTPTSHPHSQLQPHHGQP